MSDLAGRICPEHDLGNLFTDRKNCYYDVHCAPPINALNQVTDIMPTDKNTDTLSHSRTLSNAMALQKKAPFVKHISHIFADTVLGEVMMAAKGESEATVYDDVLHCITVRCT